MLQLVAQHQGSLLRGQLPLEADHIFHRPQPSPAGEEAGGQSLHQPDLDLPRLLLEDMLGQSLLSAQQLPPVQQLLQPPVLSAGKNDPQHQDAQTQQRGRPGYPLPDFHRHHRPAGQGQMVHPRPVVIHGQIGGD